MRRKWYASEAGWVTWEIDQSETSFVRACINKQEQKLSVWPGYGAGGQKNLPIPEGLGHQEVIDWADAILAMQ